MHRFYLPPEHASGPTLVLGGREAHHGLHVLRLAPGETVTVLDGAGHQCLCQVQERERDRVVLRVQERREVAAPLCAVTLLQALPKGKIIESIIQKATELGAFAIIPLLTERVVSQMDPAGAAAKAAKWQAVAVESIKQCGSAWLPKVAAPVTPRQFLARGESSELSLVGSLQNPARHSSEYFREFETAHGRKPRSVSVWVGPEGDFTAEELELIQAAGALPITLGPLVLRSETAATYCLSVVNYEITRPNLDPPR